MKELWIETHDELIDEYLEAHPDATEAEAIEATVDRVDDRFADKVGGLIDHAREMAAREERSAIIKREQRL